MDILILFFEIIISQVLGKNPVNNNSTMFAS